MRASHGLKVLWIAFMAFIPTQGFSNCSLESFQFNNRQRDFEAVQQFVNSKRTTPFYEKDSELRFSGDVRTEINYRTETQDNRTLRGGHAVDSSGVPVSRTTYDVVLNFQVDYKCDRSWAQGKMQWDQSCGIFGDDLPCRLNPEGLHGSGFCNDSCVKRAFIGYRILECKDDYKLDVEIGRRPLNNIFDSYLQFKNRFDGILIKYDKEIQPKSKFYIHGGPFIVDYRVNHYAWVFETAVLNLWDLRCDLKYSYIDWTRHGVNVCDVNHPLGSLFRNSQWTLDYYLPMEWFNRKSQLYGAYLINHAATRNVFSHFRKENTGWYAGILIGDVKKEGDWAIDISYEFCQAQAVPDTDVSGIDRGNVLKEVFFTIDERGKANYKGWEFQWLYAITDTFSANAIYCFSRPADRSIGGMHKYSKFELDLIVAF